VKQTPKASGALRRGPFGFCLLVALGGCDDCEDHHAQVVDARARDATIEAAAPPPPAPIRGKPSPAAPDQMITLASLEAADSAADAAGWGRVFVARWQRALISGAPEELLGALAAADAMLKIDDRVAAYHVTRAEALLGLRRTADAAAEQKTAIDLGARGLGVDIVGAHLDWAAGHYGATMDVMRAAGGPNASVALAVVQLGWVENETGNLDDSDRAYERAEDMLRPDELLVLAGIYQQRGLARLERGRLDDAESFLRASLARAPEHSLAATRLVEVLARQDKRDAAFAVVEPLALAARDPSLLAAASRVAPATKSAALRARARARFEELLGKTPDLMWLPAAEAFLEWNDAKRAVALLSKETEARPTARSFEALARAQLAAGDTAAARIAIERALHSPLRLARIDWTAARVYARVGEAGKSGELAARARKLDPSLPSSAPGRGE
jgi:tetratricopeptide (TPR) repeat protein